MAGAGGTMMGSPVLEGVAESGYGVTLAGFHCPTLELAKRQADYLARFPDPCDMAVFEINGYTTWILYRTDSFVPPTQRTVATFRREPHKFFQDLPKFLYTTKAQFIHRMILSGSLGSISLTVLYSPVNDIVS